MNVLTLGAVARADAPMGLVRDTGGEEHPSVVVRDVAARPRAAGHIIAVANEKGGVGKSTMAFHTCIALADAGYKVGAIDLDVRQRTLTRALNAREATGRTLKIDLPMPRYTAVEQQSGGMLCQEIGRIGWGCDFVVIDAPGQDSRGSRRAIALADTLVTPVNTSFVDLDLLGHFRGDHAAVERLGCYARTVTGIREERARLAMRPLDWIVIPNRVRWAGQRHQVRFEDALEMLAGACEFRLGGGLPERIAFRDLLMLGLTQFDLKRVPGINARGGRARGELSALLADLALPEAPLLDRMMRARA